MLRAVTIAVVVFGIVWTGVIFVESFVLLFELPRKPLLALLCVFGAIAAFVKIMFGGVLLRELGRRNYNGCKPWIIAIIILSIVVMLLILPIYFNCLSITIFGIAASISVIYTCSLILCDFLMLRFPAAPYEYLNGE